MIDEQKLNKLMNHFGKPAQILKAIEELNELSVELARHLNDIGDIENVKEEIADVTVMLEQVKLMFDFSDEEIEEIIEFKIDRALDRIK